MAACRAEDFFPVAVALEERQWLHRQSNQAIQGLVKKLSVGAGHEHHEGDVLCSSAGSGRLSVQTLDQNVPDTLSDILL